MAASKLIMMVAVLAVALLCVPSAVAQTRHVVGGNVGWTVPTSNTVYTTWASQQTFTVGDTLYFNFTTGFHDVAEVTQAAYDPCTTTSPISSNPTGPATITLTTPGNHYYLCTFRAGGHCQGGQKVTISVSAATGGPPAGSTTPPPAGSTTPPPAGSTTPPPAGSTTPPPPPPPSSASSFTAFVPITFLVAALAFFY